MNENRTKQTPSPNIEDFDPTQIQHSAMISLNTTQNTHKLPPRPPKLSTQISSKDTHNVQQPQQLHQQPQNSRSTKVIHLGPLNTQQSSQNSRHHISPNSNQQLDETPYFSLRQQPQLQSQSQSNITHYSNYPSHASQLPQHPQHIQQEKQQQLQPQQPQQPKQPQQLHTSKNILYPHGNHQQSPLHPISLQNQKQLQPEPQHHIKTPERKKLTFSDIKVHSIEIPANCITDHHSISNQSSNGPLTFNSSKKQTIKPNFTTFTSTNTSQTTVEDYKTIKDSIHSEPYFQDSQFLHTLEDEGSVSDRIFHTFEGNIPFKTPGYGDLPPTDRLHEAYLPNIQSSKLAIENSEILEKIDDEVEREFKADWKYVYDGLLLTGSTVLIGCILHYIKLHFQKS